MSDIHRAISGPFADLAKTIRRARRGLKTFDPNQPRDDHGRWTDAGVAATAAEAIDKHTETIGDAASEVSSHAYNLQSSLESIHEARLELAKDIADFTEEYGPGTPDYDAETFQEDIADIRKNAAENIADLERDARENHRGLSSHVGKLAAHVGKLTDMVNALAPSK